MTIDNFNIIRESLNTFHVEELLQSTRELLDKGVSAIEVTEGLTAALKEIGDKFDKRELFLMHLAAAGEAAKRALSEVLEPEILRTGENRKSLGKIVIGTVSGDIHDIGKSIVSAMLFTAGFEVHDLGVDVPVEEFINKIRNVDADVLGLSALLTTTLPLQKVVIEELKKEGMRDGVKVIIGGAPASEDWAEEIGADGYAGNAMDAVRVVKKLTGVD
jgi:corrinoid protein of di/trimethylamine methyltransferase